MAKQVGLKEIITSEEWALSDLVFDKEFQKYSFKATHKDGDVIKMNEDKGYVEQIIKEVEDEI